VRRTSRAPTLSAKERLVLELLAGEGELYGLQMVAASKRRLKRGTIYVTLGRMERKGFITSRLENAPPQAGGLPRRLYTLTAAGRHLHAAWDHVTQHLIPAFGR
jgi:PadR family transcriptional regulator, regulatory protein PadR